MSLNDEQSAPPVTPNPSAALLPGHEEGKKPMFKTPPSNEWLEKHLDDDEPEVIGEVAGHEEGEWHCDYMQGYWAIYEGTEIINGKTFGKRHLGIAMTEKSAKALVTEHNASLRETKKVQKTLGGKDASSEFHPTGQNSPHYFSTISIYDPARCLPPVNVIVLIEGGIGRWSGKRWETCVGLDYGQPISWPVEWWSPLLFGYGTPRGESSVSDRGGSDGSDLPKAETVPVPSVSLADNPTS